MKKENPADSVNLDILRSVAVIAVLVQHFGQQIVLAECFRSVGRAGVLLFFVHTALVLMFSLERLEDRGVNSPFAFYIQRAFRIYPLCWFFIAFALILHIPKSHVFGSYHWQGWGWVVANMLLVQNLTKTPFVLEQLWSLPYEVQMYIALPFLHRIARKKNALVWVAGVWILSVIGAGIGALLARYWEVANNGEPYVQTFRGSVLAFVPCFMGGVVAFAASRRKRLKLPGILLPVALFIFFVSYAYLPIKHSEWFLCPMLGLIVPQISETSVRFVAILSHNIAKYSYGVYLGHVPLLWLFFTKLEGVPVALRWVLFFCALVGSSVLCYRLIERPMMNRGRLIARRWTESRRIGRSEFGSVHQLSPP